MPNYSLFGGRLWSDVPFPELLAADDGLPDWTFQRSDVAPTAPIERVVGEASSRHCAVSLSRTARGYRLWHACTGTYEIEAAGSQIVWTPGEGSTAEAAHGDLIGRVMPVALHAGGVLCLHGSGVAMNDSVIGFLADSGYGKSTLAFSLVNAGAQLVSDDALVIDRASSVTVRPGVQQVRLRSDSARLLLDHETTASRGIDGKHVVRELGEERLMVAPTRLAAVYMLSPFVPRAGVDDAPVRRTRIPPSPAAIALVQHAKIGVVLSGAEAGAVLDRAAAIAREVPVYMLHIVRDLNRMDEVVAQLFDWHAAARCTAGAV